MSKLNNAMKTDFEEATLFGKPVLYSAFRIDRNTVPSKLYMYELRHGDTKWDRPCQIGNRIIVNFCGTVISDKPIPLDPDGLRDFKPSQDWHCSSKTASLQEYMERLRTVRKHTHER